MNFVSRTSGIQTIKQNDPDFIINDGLVVAKRASIEIDINCPENYKDLIVRCLAKGWIKPVAHLTSKEMMISGLLK